MYPGYIPEIGRAGFVHTSMFSEVQHCAGTPSRWLMLSKKLTCFPFLCQMLTSFQNSLAVRPCHKLQKSFASVDFVPSWVCHYAPDQVKYLAAFWLSVEMARFYALVMPRHCGFSGILWFLNFPVSFIVLMHVFLEKFSLLICLSVVLQSYSIRVASFQWLTVALEIGVCRSVCFRSTCWISRTSSSKAVSYSCRSRLVSRWDHNANSSLDFTLLALSTVLTAVVFFLYLCICNSDKVFATVVFFASWNVAAEK